MIDAHTHPVLIKKYIKKHNLTKNVREGFNLQNALEPIETFYYQMDNAGIERSILLPIDTKKTFGYRIFDNEIIAEICRENDRFIGFASLDPNSEDCLDNYEKAFHDLNLKGLKLDPSIQYFYPNDFCNKSLIEIYKKCEKENIPITFHSGLSFIKESVMKYSYPLLFEEVAQRFPKLNIIIAHFGWPWVLETTALSIKYSNIFIDTSCLYAEKPKDFINYVFNGQIREGFIENSLRYKVIFGSNHPRIEILKMVEAMRSLKLLDKTFDLIFDKNIRNILEI
ncbi:MAG: amidohydrolase [Actinobacteria bacterium]|nr:amidohydrolase [Actinomycetota bacterium]